MRKTLENPFWKNPDNINIFKRPEDHTFNCLYNVKVCLDSGFDIFTSDIADDSGRYRLSEVGAMHYVGRHRVLARRAYAPL